MSSLLFSLKVYSRGKLLSAVTSLVTITTMKRNDKVPLMYICRIHMVTYLSVDMMLSAGEGEGVCEGPAGSNSYLWSLYGSPLD